MDAEATVPCPTCKRPVVLTAGPLPEGFPFCSKRCRMVDLGAWFEGRHIIGSRDLTEEDLQDVQP